MYKVFSSLWSKSTSLPSTPKSSVEDDGWVYVTDSVALPATENQNAMTNSWIASPPLMKAEEPSLVVRQLNPIENLLIEHASMSVYEDIASKTSHRRQRDIVRHEKLEEQTEDDDDDEDDEAASTARQNLNLISIQSRALNGSSNSLNVALESSTSSLASHQRHLNRLQQRRKRTSKLLTNNSTEESKQVLHKVIDRPRCNHPRSTKINVPLRPQS